MKYVPEKHLFQYDQGVYIIVPDEYRNCTAQFYSKSFPKGLAMENEIIDGKIMCQIPNQMLVNAESIIVYAFRTGTNIVITESLSKFSVAARPKPPDFVLDPTDTVTYKTASDLITDMQTAKSEESKRVAAESLRASAEIERASSETVRKSSEVERAKAESDRVSAEQLRAAAETERAGFYEGFNSELNSLKDNLTEQNTRIAALEKGGDSSSSGSNVAVARATITTRGSIVNNSTKEEWRKFLTTMEGYLEVTREDTGMTYRCPFLGSGVAADTKGSLLVFSFGSFYNFASNEKSDEYLAFGFDEQSENGIVGYSVYDRTTQMLPAATVN